MLFHGVNVVYKVDPFIPDTDKFDSETSLSDEDIEDLQAWGINLVRLGVTWQSVERGEGVYDFEYLAHIEKIINKLAAKGIYTLLDAH